MPPRRSHTTALLALAACPLIMGACAPERPHELIEELPQQEQERGDQRQQVAVINGERILLADFEAYLKDLAPFGRVKVTTPGKRQEMLESVARFEVLADVAEREQRGDSPETRQAIKRYMAEQLERSIAASVPNPDDEALKAAYDNDPALRHQPARARLATIVLDDQAIAARTRQRFEQNYGQFKGAQRVEAFQRFANNFNIDRALADKRGLLPWLTMRQELADDPDHQIAAELQRPGALSQPYKTSRGWQISMLIERQPAKDLPLAEIEQSLRAKLRARSLQEARRKRLETLQAKTRVSVRPQAANKLKAPPKALPQDVELWGASFGMLEHFLSAQKNGKP